MILAVVGIVLAPVTAAKLIQRCGLTSSRVVLVGASGALLTRRYPEEARVHLRKMAKLGSIRCTIGHSDTCSSLSTLSVSRGFAAENLFATVLLLKTVSRHSSISDYF